MTYEVKNEKHFFYSRNKDDIKLFAQDCQRTHTSMIYSETYFCIENKLFEMKLSTRKYRTLEMFIINYTRKKKKKKGTLIYTVVYTTKQKVNEYK